MEQDITIYLAKAAESLQTAESEFANGRYNSCANRCYYACFQAAIAALLAEGIRARGQWSHEFVQGQFVGVLIDIIGFNQSRAGSAHRMRETDDDNSRGDCVSRMQSPSRDQRCLRWSDVKHL